MERSQLDERCPDAGTLAQLASGELSEDTIAPLQEHFDRCAQCRAVMVAVVKMSAPPPASEDPPASDRPRTLTPGQTVGRYVIEGVVGSGGSSVVYRARDEGLQRAVALKLLRERPGSAAEHDSADARLRREARALARLDHPGIVDVYEVGSFAGATFMAMALVDGVNLREWLTQARPHAEIAEVFVQAAAALAAAHGQGLVHRDFKPENVMVDRTGRVRVMDFGLVRNAGKTAGSEPPTNEAAPETTDPSLTRTGTLAGTPAYMAPEQFAGARVDAAADQFAWCVCLHEAIYGVRPFPGRTPAELADSVRRGERVQAPRAAPAAIERILRRGLDPEPGRRFPTMDACADALRASHRGNRVRAAGFVAVAAVVIAGVALRPEPKDPLCVPPADHPWTTEHAALERAMSRFSEPFGRQTWELVAPRVEAYLEAIDVERQRACAADVSEDPRRGAHVRGLAAHDARLRGVVASWSQPSHAIVGAAIDVIAGLPAPGGCRGTPKVAAPTGEARRLEAVMATARVQLDYAQHRAGLETLNPWRNVSTDPPRDAAAHYLRGQLAGGAGDDALAQAELKRAAELSAELGDDRAVAEAWIARISIAADRDVDQEFARSLCDVADVAVTRANDDALLRAGLLQACAGIEFRAANWEEAERLQRRAAERAAAAAGPEHPKVSRALINLGSVLRLRGDFDGAIAQHRRALEIAERSYGPAHPRVAKVEAALGADFGAKGLLPRAREHLQRALAVYHQTLPDDHPNIISVLADLGRVARELGDLDAAEGLAERVVAARRDAGGIRLANALLRRAEVRLERGEIVEAQVDFSEAAELMEALHGPQYAPLSGPLVGLGKCALALNDHAAAVAPLKRALALRGDTKNQSVLASVEFLLAKASWGEGIDRAGAVRLAHAAAARYRTIAPDHAESLAAVQQWLTDHEPLLREH